MKTGRRGEQGRETYIGRDNRTVFKKRSLFSHISQCDVVSRESATNSQTRTFFSSYLVQLKQMHLIRLAVGPSWLESPGVSKDLETMPIVQLIFSLAHASSILHSVFTYFSVFSFVFLSFSRFHSSLFFIHFIPALPIWIFSLLFIFLSHSVFASTTACNIALFSRLFATH